MKTFFFIEKKKWLLLLLVSAVYCTETKSQGKYISYPEFDEYTQIGTCVVSFNNICIIKQEKAGVANYILCLNNKMEYDPYAQDLLGIPVSDVDVPYEERKQAAIVLFTDASRVSVPMNFVKNKFKGNLSLSQFNTIKSKEIKGVKLLKSDWEYSVDDNKRAEVKQDLQLLSKSIQGILDVYKAREKEKEESYQMLKERAERYKKELEQETLNHVESKRIIKESESNEIFEVVEQMPRFPDGGDDGLMQYLARNVKYPTLAKENGAQGYVVVKFVVEKDGNITDVHVGNKVDPYLASEAIRVIKHMPKWKPGIHKNEIVRVKYAVRIGFKL